MQLGTRWAAGTTPPRSVPAELHTAIADAEQRAAATEGTGGATAHWTLTWLEGRPIAELDAGWEVLLTADGEVVARPWQD